MTTPNSVTKLISSMAFGLAVLTSVPQPVSAAQPVAEPVETTELDGKFFMLDRGDAVVHTYMAPESGFHVTTHIIETENGLVVVDGQFVPDHAKEISGYIEALGKPVLRTLISHAHPDHFTGLSGFGKSPVYATEATRDFIAAAGQSIIDEYKLGGEVVIPDNIISMSTEVIDGLTWDYMLAKDAEAEEQIVVLLPQIGVVVAQDIIYNSTYMYIDHTDLSGWKDVVEELAALEGYSVVLPGHGEPTDTEIFDDVLEYLSKAEAILETSDDKETLSAMFMEAYPDFRIPALIDIGLGNMLQQ